MFKIIAFNVYYYLTFQINNCYNELSVSIDISAYSTNF